MTALRRATKTSSPPTASFTRMYSDEVVMGRADRDWVTAPAGVMAAGPSVLVERRPGTRTWAAGRSAFPAYSGGAGVASDIDDYDAVELALEELERVHGDMSHGERAVHGRTAPGCTCKGPIGVLRRPAPPGGRAGLPVRVADGPHRAFGVRTVHVVPNVESTFAGYFTPTSPRQPHAARLPERRRACVGALIRA